MIKVIPTILVKTYQEFESTVRKIENDFDMAQIDVMDGAFVPNKTFFDLAKILQIQTALRYELHLMVEEPIEFIEKSARYEDIMSDRIRRILFHFEATKKIEETIEYIRGLKKDVGLVINPQTSVEQMQQFVPKLDMVMVMGVEPGFSGQAFIPETVDKVQALRAIDPNIEISVDGGVDDLVSQKLIAAGATILSANSFLYQGTPLEQSKKLLH